MRFGYLVGMSLQTELIILAILGILYTIFDASLLEFNSNMTKIWDIKMDPQKFSDRAELYMKYTISGIVLVRTFTIHIYLGSYVVMLYPLFFEDRPGLLIPWMTMNVLKSILTSIIAFMAGIYVCMVYNFSPPSCWEFLLTHYLEIAPSCYMLCLVITFYKELKKLIKLRKYIHPLELRARRHRVRMVSDSKIDTDYREIFSRSLDGLLEKIKEDDESDGHSSNFEKKVSFDPVNSYAESFGTTSSYQDRQTETSRLETAVAYTQSFQVSGNVICILPDERMMRSQGTDFDGIDQLEELERISDLDNSYKTPQNASIALPPDPPPPSTPETPAIKDDLVEDITNLVFNKRGGFYSDNYKRDSKALLVPEKPSPQDSLRTRMLDATMQANSPTFEDVILGMVQMNNNNNKIDDDSHDIDDSLKNNAKRKSTLTEPSMAKNAKSQLMPEMEGSSTRAGGTGTRTNAQPVKQLYKNRTAYPTSYRDDGYTQAFYKNMDRNRQSKSPRDDTDNNN